MSRPASTLLHAGACEQARAVAAGEVTADELREAQCAAAAMSQPELNCFVALAGPGAPASARPADAGLLWGSTFAAKDNIDVAGFVTHAGLRAFGTGAALRDAPVVARLREAGLWCLGKLNMHPMALGATNRNRDFGPCINPRGASLTPGGSSGGSAAAVAAGLCSLALGTDTMGSVRLPAAYCGVVGFKPGHETLGLEGVVPLCRQLDHVGVLARRVEDIAAAMAAMAPGRARVLRDSPRADCGAGRPPRLAALGDARGAGATPEVARAYDRALQALRAGGWEVGFFDLVGIDLGAARRAGLLLCEAELHAVLRPLLQTRPEALPDDLLAMMRYIEGRSAVDLGRAVAQVARTGEAVDRLSDRVDALLLPTAPHTAFAMDGPVPPSQADFTALANMNGAPAISLPVPVAADALPVGLQLVGHRGDEAGLLALAAQAEAALARSALARSAIA